MEIVGRKKTRSPFLGDRTEPGRFVAERAAEISFSQLSCLHWDSMLHRPSTFIGIDGEDADQVPWARTSKADAPDVGADRTSHKALGQLF
jgi:hypothetical protein